RCRARRAYSYLRQVPCSGPPQIPTAVSGWPYRESRSAHTKSALDCCSDTRPALLAPPPIPLGAAPRSTAEPSSFLLAPAAAAETRDLLLSDSRQGASSFLSAPAGWQRKSAGPMSFPSSRLRLRSSSAVAGQEQ